MANVITKQTIMDGPRNLVVKATIVGDGVEGEYTDELLINVSDYSSPTPDGTNPVKITKIWACLNGFSATLEWDATTNVDILTIPQDEDFDQDYTDISGLANNAGTGITGDILIDTAGLGAEEGTLLLWMRKS